MKITGKINNKPAREPNVPGETGSFPTKKTVETKDDRNFIFFFTYFVKCKLLMYFVKA